MGTMFMNFDFFSFLATTGVWVGIYMGLIAAFELSRFTRLFTRFTHEIFACFVCSVYISDGIRGIVSEFYAKHDINDYHSVLTPDGNVTLVPFTPFERAANGM